MPRRILLFVTDLQIGGTPRIVCELAVRLNAPPEVTVHVACLAGEGPMAAEIRGRGVTVTPLGARSVADVAVFARLVQLIRRERFDTVLSFLMHANVAAAAAALRCPGVHFMQSIQTTQARPRWHWVAQRAAARKAVAIVVPSASVAAAAIARAGIAKEKIVVIPNGVDLPPDRAAPAAAGEIHRVVFLGRLDPVKRLPDLVQAMALLRGFARLDIYGEGRQRRMLEKQIRSLDLGTSIMLHGAIAAPGDALAGAGLLVLPSEAEGFGLVLIEAMAAGVAVVASDVPGIRDVVQNRKTGLLVPPYSPAALAAAMRWVLEDAELRQGLIAAALADVRRRFTWDSVMPRYRELLGV